MINIIDRKSRAKIEVMNEENSQVDPDNPFWEHLNKRAQSGDQDQQSDDLPSTSAEPTHSEQDLQKEEQLGGIAEILEVVGDSGTMDVRTVWSKPKHVEALHTNGFETTMKPSKNVLSSKSVYIIDCISELFVYTYGALFLSRRGWLIICLSCFL